MKIQELTCLYSPLDIEISQIMSGHYTDLSYHGDDCEVIAYMKNDRISGAWRPMVAVGDDKSLKTHIERLYDICRDIFYMDFLIDGKLSVISQFLLKQGYKARPIYTQIIDCTKSTSELHADLRKSYTSLINKYKGVICGAGVIKAMKEMHIEQRGTQTRPDKTWEIQAEMIKNGRAYISATVPRSAACLIYHNKYTAHYAVGCSDKDKNSHAALWEGMLEAKRIGCKTFELGEQVFSVGAKMMGSADKPKFANKKDVDISLFKRGFGGRTVVRLILEK